MSDTNAFGGKNPNGLYVPMSELEQECLSRLVEAGDLRVHVREWGIVNQPRARYGDGRLQLAFRMNFDRPEIPQPVYYFDLELKTSSGLLLFKERQSVMYDGKPVSVAAGVFFDLVWDIGIRSIDPKVVKAVLPYARGLTSRLQDKDTGEMTLTGNMKLDSRKKKLLYGVRQAEERNKVDTKAKAVKATKAEG